jgi:outer membrane biogenesis lipoprotein LolB
MFRMRTRLVLAAVAVLLGGCVSMTARTAADYDRGSAAEQKFQSDAAGCAKEAEAHQKEFGYGPYDPTRGPYNRLYDACMRSRGYQLRQQP